MNHHDFKSILDIFVMLLEAHLECDARLLGIRPAVGLSPCATRLQHLLKRLSLVGRKGSNTGTERSTICIYQFQNPGRRLLVYTSALDKNPLKQDIHSKSDRSWTLRFGTSRCECCQSLCECGLALINSFEIRWRDQELNRSLQEGCGRNVRK